MLYNPLPKSPDCTIYLIVYMYVLFSADAQHVLAFLDALVGKAFR